jgi:hypothetical protein
VLLALAFLPQHAEAHGTRALSAATAKKKHHTAKKRHKPAKPTHCTLGHARLRVGKRTLCVHNSLPATSLTPQSATALTALNLGIGKTRDRRGRRSKSLAQLLSRIGPHAHADLEKAISTGLSEGESLELGGAHSARAATAGRAAESGSGCGSGVQDLPGSKSAKVGEGTLSLDIEGGAVKLGIDLKGKGIDVSVQLRSCGDGSLNLDSCPTAEGKVEGHGQAELEASFKVSEGATVVMAQAFKFGGETSIKAQTGDDGKLDYYDIKHLYTLVGSFGGSKAKFGPITVDTTYIGEAHIDMRSTGGAPPPAQVDVMLSMAGADPAERIAAEIKVARESQAQADKEFAAEVEKVTKQLQAQQGSWLTPNKCASIQFEPASETLELHKGATGTVKSRTEAKGGGAPAVASWTLAGQQNADFTPSGGQGNPLSTAYNVTNAGKGLLVSATFTATSKAGVAEGTWKQKTENVIQSMKGSFSGRDEREGELLEWSGTATWTRLPESPDGTSILGLVSAEVTVTASGFAPTGCTQTGQEKVPVFIGSPLSVLGEGAPVAYDIDVPFGYPGQMNVTFTKCPTPHGEGEGPGTTSLPGEALLTGDPIAGDPSKIHPSALVQTSTDGVTFAGSATGSGTEPGERLSWSWSLEGST